MKHIKAFTNNKNLKYKVEDYVLLHMDNNYYSRYQSANNDVNKYFNFINNSIGKIIYIPPIEDEQIYHIQYEDVPDDISRFFFIKDSRKNIEYAAETPYYIIYSSSNREDVEAFIQSRKYNL